eukprot:m.74556 g.74556  ORF g.74556 m.74556 type:complete len:186 (-) comp24673_c0_seq2:84-641(-)
MVRFGNFCDRFSETFEDVTAAVWQKYPNPISAHVLSVDTLRRHVDPTTGCMLTTRLLTKTNVQPRWFQKFIGNTNKTTIVEESVLDPKAKTFTTYTKNISLNYFMTVEETCVYTVSEDNSSWTVCNTNARISSEMLIGRIVEKFGIDRYTKNAAKGKAAISYKLQELKQKLILPSSPLRAGAETI